MQMAKLYKVLVLGGSLSLAGCGTIPNGAPENEETTDTPDASHTVADAGNVVDAGDTLDAGETPTESPDGGGVCGWGMSPCPC